MDTCLLRNAWDNYLLYSDPIAGCSIIMHHLSCHYLGEDAAAVENLRKKMMTNLDHARDRVNFLCKQHNNNMLTEQVRVFSH